MSRTRLAGRTVVVTGAAQGQGAAEVAAAAQRLGVADDQIHIEEFGF